MSDPTAISRPVVMALVAVLALMLAGCASPHYDPATPQVAVTSDVAGPPSSTLEPAYRAVYAGLDRCYGDHYHVQPRFDRARGEAWIMLVTGLGLDRLSLLGNRFEARVDLFTGERGVTARVARADRGFEALPTQVANWLRGAGGCAA